MEMSYTRKETLDALRRQVLVQCDADAAKRLAKVVRVVALKPSSVVIKQDAGTDDIFFVLQGSVEVFVNGTRVATRLAGQHVGEMAALLRSRRTATVITAEETTLAKIGRKDFLRIACACPVLLRNMATELAQRLNERRNLIREPNRRPYIFIGSSKKHESVAMKIKDGLGGLSADIEVWSEPGVFAASHTFIETLTKAAKRADFAILIFGKDDLVISKGRRSYVPRDNVVFEAGLFIGAISRERTFLVRPKNAQIRILTDLAGVTLLDYQKLKKEINCTAACNQISNMVKKQWVR